MNNKNITIFPNLIENVLKLSSELRNSGFATYADNLEQKLLTLKVAAKNAGEDLIHSAHPEGSHKLEGVEGPLAVVETILDKHLQMVKVVNKTPTGKLASKQIIAAVKNIFAQAHTSEELYDVLNENKKKTLKLLDVIDSVVDSRGNLSLLPGGRAAPYKAAINRLHDLFSEDMTVDNINSIHDIIKRVKKFISPGYTGGVSEDAWDVIGPLFDKFDPYFTNMLEARHNLNNLERESYDTDTRKPVSTFVLTPEARQLFNSIDEHIKNLDSYKPFINKSNKLNVAQKNSELSWIDSQIKELQDLKSAGPTETTYNDLSKLFGPNGDVTQYYKTRSWIKS